MFKVDFVMDKHSESVCRSTVWNLLGIASRVWPAVSCQVPCVGGGCSLLCAQSAIPDVDGVMHCMPKLPLAREAHDASAQFSDRAVDTHGEAQRTHVQGDVVGKQMEIQ